MSEKIRVSGGEREQIVRGFQEGFPKYTTQILNIANQNARSTRPECVGNMSDIITEFRNKYPDGKYEEWVRFYEEEYDGEEALSESAAQLHEMVEKMEEAIAQIDQEMAHRYIRQLVLYKTYMGESADIEEVVIAKLEQVYGTDIEVTPDSWILGRLRDVPFVVESLHSGVEEQPPENVATVYYREESNNSIIIDPAEIDERLGTTITDDDEAHRSLGSFSFTFV